MYSSEHSQNDVCPVEGTLWREIQAKATEVDLTRKSGRHGAQPFEGPGDRV